MSEYAHLLAEVQRLTAALHNERVQHQAARADLLRFTQAKARLHGHCRECEYVPDSLKPYTKPATERFHNGG